jgi:nitroreductase
MVFNQLIKARKSIRNFKTDLPTKECLGQVLEAARLAPSAVNYQPWQFIVVTQSDKLSELHDCYHKEWFNSAPACIVVLGNHKESWHRAADGKDYCDIDVAIAIDHLTLQAAELGLGTCWVCNFENDKVRLLFNLPSHLEAIALIPVGYPVGDGDLLPVEKKRKSLKDIVEWIS